MTADLPTHDYLDELVDTDPLKLRDEAYALRARVENAETALARFRAWLDTDFRFWCSPHGVAARYATDLIKHLDRLVAEEQTGGPEGDKPLRHCGGNAEDCPACDTRTMPYPFLCPGEEQSAPATTQEAT